MFLSLMMSKVRYYKTFKENRSLEMYKSWGMVGKISKIFIFENLVKYYKKLLITKKSLDFHFNQRYNLKNQEIL